MLLGEATVIEREQDLPPRDICSTKSCRVYNEIVETVEKYFALKSLSAKGP
jgi:hypothetical protein